jgi:hypothetical protein
MQLPDIWQIIGSPQVAEITAIVSILISLLSQRSLSTGKLLKNPFLHLNAATS